MKDETQERMRNWKPRGSNAADGPLHMWHEGWERMTTRAPKAGWHGLSGDNVRSRALQVVLLLGARRCHSYTSSCSGGWSPTLLA